MHRVRHVRRHLPEQRHPAGGLQRRAGARGAGDAAWRRKQDSGIRTQDSAASDHAEPEPEPARAYVPVDECEGLAPGVAPLPRRWEPRIIALPLLLVLVHRRRQRRHRAAEVPGQRGHHPRDVLGPHRPRAGHDRLRPRRGRRDGVRLPHRRLPLHRRQPQDDGAHAAAVAGARGFRHRAGAVRPRVGQRRRGREVRAPGATGHRAGAAGGPARLARADAAARRGARPGPASLGREA